MDIGKFKASQKRLILWIVIPPVLVVGVALSSYAWKQRAAWRLTQAEELAEIVPTLVGAQYASETLIATLGLGAKDGIRTEDQLISFLQDAALKQGFVINAVKVDRLEGGQAKGVLTLSASVSGSGDFVNIQAFLKEIQSDQNMLSIQTLSLEQSQDQVIAHAFRANIMINLMMLDKAFSAAGGEA